MQIPRDVPLAQSPNPTHFSVILLGFPAASPTFYFVGCSFSISLSLSDLSVYINRLHMWQSMDHFSTIFLSDLTQIFPYKCHYLIFTIRFISCSGLWSSFSWWPFRHTYIHIHIQNGEPHSVYLQFSWCFLLAADNFPLLLPRLGLPGPLLISCIQSEGIQRSTTVAYISMAVTLIWDTAPLSSRLFVLVFRLVISCLILNVLG